MEGIINSGQCSIGNIRSAKIWSRTESRPEKKNNVRKQADKNNSNRITKNLLSTVHQERADWHEQINRKIKPGRLVGKRNHAVEKARCHVRRRKEMMPL